MGLPEAAAGDPRRARPRGARSASSTTRVPAGAPAAARAARWPCVLLIDEIDRADSEFEAFLLEFLSDFQITIPELGTVTAPTPPIVVLTSNRTRELHDALKRRCLYHWIAFPGRRARAGDHRRAACRAWPRTPRHSLVEAVSEVRAAEADQAAGHRRDDRLGAGGEAALRRGCDVADRAAALARAAAQGAGGHRDRPRRLRRPGTVSRLSTSYVPSGPIDNRSRCSTASSPIWPRSPTSGSTS